MDGIPPRHVYEVQRWLGLVPHDEPDGLHGSRRGSLLMRYTRNIVVRVQPKGPLPPLLQAQVGTGWRYVADALVKTYPGNREPHIMALLRPQRLDDRLWRWVYALMVTGGPVLLPDLITFVTRLTGPRAIAEAEALSRYREWSAKTHYAE